jgi:hypothetical protein
MAAGREWNGGVNAGAIIDAVRRNRLEASGAYMGAADGGIGKRDER